MTILVWACAPAPAGAPEPSPTAAPSTGPSAVKSAAEPVFRGASDASAAVWGGEGDIWVADDEQARLQRWRADGGPPLGTLDLGLGKEEADIEGAAAVGERRWWIGSHGRNKDGKPRPARQQLIATDAAGRPVGRVATLLPALLALPEVRAQLAAAEPLPPKEGGLNIEGLAADSGRQDLWIGFRSPLSASGGAWVVRLRHPEALLAGAAPELDVPIQLDLGGRGVRSFEWDEARHHYWIVAGPSGKAGDFALYAWAGPGTAPVRNPVDIRGLNPEALLVTAEGALLLLSDDGTLPNGDGDNKDAPEARRTFRGRLVVPK